MESRKAELLQRVESDRDVLIDFLCRFLRCPSPNPRGGGAYPRSAGPARHRVSRDRATGDDAEHWLWRYKELPAIVYGPSPTGMGSFDEHVTVEEFLHVVKCHVLSAYDYLVRPG
jgi:hypothetical protein